MNEVEQKRKIMQDALDALKTQKERNSMGQFSTPYPLALEIMCYMRNLLKRNDVSFIAREPIRYQSIFQHRTMRSNVQ